MQRPQPLTGTVLEIIRMSTEDGPGLRTTVFLKGCPLKCAWCHNPESISPKMQMQWISSRCIGCRSCVATCVSGCLSADEGGIRRNEDICVQCAHCAEACPTTAMERLGTPWTPETLCAELLKDRAYFERSEKGGVTLSGGEATMQADFAEALLSLLVREGVHTALDTCGYCRAELLSRLLPLCDLVLFDLKDWDEARHRANTGVGLEVIHERLGQVAAQMRRGGKPRELWIRTPVIPGVTTDPECVRGIGRDIQRLAGGQVARWELCAFNNLCADKYTRLGKRWRFDGSELLDEDTFEAVIRAAKESGVDPAIVIGTGATRPRDAV